MTFTEANRLATAITEATARCRHSSQPFRELMAYSANLLRAGWTENQIRAFERAVMFDLTQLITPSSTQPKAGTPEAETCYIIQ